MVWIVLLFPLKINQNHCIAWIGRFKNVTYEKSNSMQVDYGLIHSLHNLSSRNQERKPYQFF